MQFPNPIVNRIVIYGTDGLPDVSIGPTPVITMYDGADVILQFGIFGASTVPRLLMQNASGDTVTLALVSGNPTLQVADSDSNAIRLTTDSSGPVAIFDGATPSGFGRIYHFKDVIVSPFFADGFYFDFLGRSGDIATMIMRDNIVDGTDTEIVSNKFIQYAPTGINESWHNVTVLSGAGTVQYRLMIDGCVMLRGSIAGFVNATGTALFTLPVPYRPGSTVRFVCATGVDTTTTYAQIQINTLGQCVVARPVVGGAVSAWFDSVRFASAAIG
jgi:hypothetical protein